MLKVINTKLLIAILVALGVIAGVLVHIRNASERSAQILQQQQDATDAARKHDEETKEFVSKQHQKNSAYPTNGSDTLKNYIP